MSTYAYINLTTPLSVTDETGATTAYDRMRIEYRESNFTISLKCMPGRDNAGEWEAAPLNRTIRRTISAADYTTITGLDNPAGVTASHPAMLQHVFQWLIDNHFPGTLVLPS